MSRKFARVKKTIEIEREKREEKTETNFIISIHNGDEDRPVSIFGMTPLTFYNSGKSSTPGSQQPSDVFQGDGIPTSSSCQPCFLFGLGFLSLDFFFHDPPNVFYQV